MANNRPSQITMTDSIENELSALERNLKAATERYAAAVMIETAASRDRCAALNDMNAAQRQLGQYLKKLRTEAPADSDWGLDRNGRGIAVEQEVTRGN